MLLTCLVCVSTETTQTTSVLPAILGCVGGSLLGVGVCIIIITRKTFRKRYQTRYGDFKAVNPVFDRY